MAITHDPHEECLKRLEKETRRKGRMIDIDWTNDERNTDPSKYSIKPDSNEGRRKAFLGGWTRFISNAGSTTLDRVTWVGLGMVYASILGDMPLDQRKDIYRLLLSQYLSSDRVGHWTVEQREEALRLVTES